jgi:hypothetical protein
MLVDRLGKLHPLILFGALTLLLSAILAVGLWPRPQPPAEPLFENLGFESGLLPPWSIVGDPGCAVLVTNPAQALEGRRFLHIDSRNRNCTSIRYDTPIRPAKGNVFRFAIGARSTVSRLQPLHLVVWVGKDPLEVGGVDLNQEAVAAHVVGADDWHCVEVALEIVRDDFDVVRAELYLPADPAVQLDIDKAQISFEKDEPICATQPMQILDGSFEQTQDQLAWRFRNQPCDWLVLNEAGEAQDGRRFLRITRNDGNCRSLYYDIPTKPLAGIPYGVRAWLRSAGEKPTSASLNLYAHGGEPASASKTVLLFGSEWRCVGVRLTVKEQIYQQLQVELHLATPNATYDLDHVEIVLGDEPLCPDQERDDAATGWQQPNTGCTIAVIQDPAQAHQGDHYLSVTKASSTCLSIFQDVAEQPQVGDTATMSLWVRGRGTPPIRGHLRLWAISGSPEENTLSVTLPPDRWVCLETTLTIRTTWHDHWRGEFYFETLNATYDLDNVQFRFEERAGCPQTEYAVRDFRLLDGQFAVAGSTLSGRLEVENLGPAVETESYAQLWLADHPAGGAVSSEATAFVPIPPLAAGATSQPIYFDLPLPTNLISGTTYFAPLQLRSVHVPQSATLRPTLRLTIVPCDPATLFCDVPAGYWAQGEIEAWYTAGITRGCRSGTEPHRNLPFCPGGVLWPEVMAIFLLRQRHGADYQPPTEYRGIYADVPADHPRAQWIEAFYDQLGDLPRSNCPQKSQTRTFCPTEPVLRADLLRYVAAIWPLAKGEGSAFVDLDLAADPQLAALAATFQALGLLPVDDPHCPDLGLGPRFCPADRADAAIWMARAAQLASPGAAE